MSHAILTVEDVSKTYDGFKAITDLTFYLFPGELRTVIGPNGAGKSTFFDLITGRARPDKGKIEFGVTPSETRDLTTFSEYQINRLGVGRKFQTPSVYVEHTVFNNLVLSLKGPRGVFSSLLHRLSSTERDRIDELLKLIRLDGKRGWKAGLLAHGEKQWLEIGMLLAQEPKVLLVDEPAAGMTDEETHRTGELLISLAGKHSLIVIEHDMAFVRQIAERVVVMAAGAVLADGEPADVLSRPEVLEAYIGPNALKALQ
jgi:urea transport system ATP-binding protein